MFKLLKLPHESPADMREVVLAPLRRLGIDATQGIILSKETGDLLSKIPRDFHLRHVLDPRDMIIADSFASSHCLINRFL